MLDISRPDESLIGTRFMVPIPSLEKDGRESWPITIEAEYEYYLERSGNRSVLTGQKREDYRRWLRNPNGRPIGETTEERRADQNTRTQGKHCFSYKFSCINMIF
jgi:hypothetical protein